MNSAEIVNVLSPCMKNGGSEDISAIVNEASKEHSLFLPKGVYKVSHPIYLRNSIKGDGYSRYTKTSDDHTWLVSAIENEDSSVGIINIENILLKCNTKECGLRLASCSQHNRVFPGKVGIFDVSGYGVYEDGAASFRCTENARKNLPLL